MELFQFPAYHDHLDSPLFCFVLPIGERAGTFGLFAMTDEFSNEILGINNSFNLNFEDDLLLQSKIMEATRRSHTKNKLVFLNEFD